MSSELMSGSLDQSLLLGCAIVIAVELVVLVWRHPLFGLWLAAGAAVLSTFGWPPGIVLGGFQVYLLDLTVGVLAGTTALTLRRSRPLSASVIALLALLGFAVLRGIAEFGSEHAVNASRGLLYFLVAVAFVQVCVKDALPTIRRAWVALSMIPIGSAAAFWFQHGFGTYAVTGDRALSSSQALLVSHAGLLLASEPLSLARPFTVACLVVVLASQQRTAWAATVLTVTLLVAVAGAPHMRRFSRGARRGLVGALLVIVALLALGPSGLQESTTAATTNISLDSGTFGWRVQSWIALLEDFFDRSFADQAFGQSAGTGFDRTIFGGTVTVSPHNMYITVLVSLGYAGLLGFLMLMYRSLRSARNVDPTLWAVVAGLLVFSIAYQLGPEHGLLVGAALAPAATSRPHPSAPPGARR